MFLELKSLRRLAPSLFSLDVTFTDTNTLRMLKAQGRRLTSKAQEVVMDGKNKLIRYNNNNGDGQTDLLTKEEEQECE